jgi:Sel1 repeat
LVEARLCIAYNGQENDYAKCMEYFLKAAACTPHPSSYEAMKHLGFMYEYGQGVEVNLNQALSYYEQSANGGSPDGCYCLGLHYYNLIQTNAIHLENLGKATMWLDKAAELGYNQDPELIDKCIYCWDKTSQAQVAVIEKYRSIIAQHQQSAEYAQVRSDKWKQTKSLQIGQTGNMAEQSGPEVVAPAETPAVVNSVVAPVNSESEKGKEEEKKKEVASQPDNFAAKALTKTNGPAMFSNSAPKDTPPLNQDSASEEGWTPAGGKRSRGRGRGHNS